MNRTILAIASLMLTLATTATAQSRTAQVQALIDVAHAEQRVFLTCTRLMPNIHADLSQFWSRMVNDADTALGNLGFSLIYRAAFRMASMPAVLMLPNETPFSELKAYCDADPDWQQAVIMLDFTMLDLELGNLSPQ